MNSNPLTLVIIKGGLEQIAEEMDTWFERTAFSPAISESQNRASGLYAGSSGDLLVQGSRSYPLYTGALEFTLKQLLESEASLAEGDVYLCNDPYRGSISPNHIILIKPYFYQGHRFAFLANMGQHLDIGSRSPTGFSPRVQDIYQEGVRLPLIKFYSEDRPDDDILKILLGNSRFPKTFLGDLQAQIHALRMGAQRLTRLLNRYGLAIVRESIEELQRRSELEMRRYLREIPKGVYTFSDYLDRDQPDGRPLKISLNFKVTDTGACLDFSESDPPSDGPFNSTLATTLSSCYLALKHIYPEIPLSAGSFKPFQFIVPKETFLNAPFPKPVSASVLEISQRIVDVIFGVFHQAAPGRAIAGSFSTGTSFSLYGQDPVKGSYKFTGSLHGGYGGSNQADGLTNGSPLVGLHRLPSLEVLETRYPLLFQEYKIREGSAGAGRFRGGFGVVCTFTLRRGQAFFSILGGRGVSQPFGVANGWNGSSSRYVFQIQGVRYIYGVEASEGKVPPVLSKFRTPSVIYLISEEDIPLQAGDSIHLETPGGGGYGSPFVRSIRLVTRDVKGGYITREQAMREYGVFFQKDSLELDIGKTSQMRHYFLAFEEDV
jgi:N-methylhydantoinase B